MAILDSGLDSADKIDFYDHAISDYRQSKAKMPQSLPIDNVFGSLPVTITSSSGMKTEAPSRDSMACEDTF